MGYREGREWWEGIIALRKISIVAIGTFGTLMGVVDLQAFIALAIVFLSIIVHLIGEPFDKKRKNSLLLHNLEFAALTICWCTFWAGLLYFLGHQKPDSVSLTVKHATTIIIVGVNVIFMLIGFYIFVREYLRDRRHAIIRRTLLITSKNDTAEQRSKIMKNLAKFGPPPSSVQIQPKNDTEDDKNKDKDQDKDKDNNGTDNDKDKESTAITSAAAQAREKEILSRFQNMSHNIDIHDIHDATHAENVINEYHGHEERFNKLTKRRSLLSQKKTDLRLLSRSKLKSSKALSKVPGFSHFNDSKISTMVDNMKLIKYGPNDIICNEGDVANCFYVILEGNCKITSIRHGTERMATIGQHKFFGENALIGSSKKSERKRGASVTVVSEMEENEDMKQKGRHGAQVLVLERAQYDALCNGKDIDFADTNISIEEIATQRKRENRQSLIEMRKAMVLKGGEKKTEEKTSEEKRSENDFSFDGCVL
tara:strand:+ start:73 stop:1515 length:1443 start_codon:yes stop_codon:yes gene_type:complete